MVTKYVERTLPTGEVIKYRRNPERTSDGKVKPTKKQERSREALSKRMTVAQKIMQIEFPTVKPGTKEFGKKIGNILSKNKNEETGQKKSRLVKARAHSCRKGSKIARCNNVIRNLSR